MLTDRLPTLHSWPVFLAVSGVVLTVLFVLLEPEPSQSLGPGASVVFWSLHVLVQIAILQAVQSGLSRIWPARWPLPVLQIVAAGLIGAALFTPVAVWVEIFLAVVGVDDEIVGLRLHPLGLRRNRDRQAYKKHCYKTHHHAPSS